MSLHAFKEPHIDEFINSREQILKTKNTWTSQPVITWYRERRGRNVSHIEWSSLQEDRNYKKFSSTKIIWGQHKIYMTQTLLGTKFIWHKIYMTSFLQPDKDYQVHMPHGTWHKKYDDKNVQGTTIKWHKIYMTSTQKTSPTLFSIWTLYCITWMSRLRLYDHWYNEFSWNKHAALGKCVTQDFFCNNFLDLIYMCNINWI